MRRRDFVLGLGAALAAAVTTRSVWRVESAAAPAINPTLPRIGAWGFDLSGIDLQANPGDGFFNYANGSWDARTEIPADKSKINMFRVIRDMTEIQCRAIVERAARSAASPDTEAGKIGRLYDAFMDEERIEKLDAEPIAGDLAKVRAAKTKTDIAVLMGHSIGGFGASLFNTEVDLDGKDPSRHTLYISQSGRGLDRDYYLNAAFADKKARYRDYVARLLDMVGWPAAQRHADEIIALETRIAEVSWSRAESRNRDKTYNPASPAELEAYAPGFPWSAWLGAAQVAQVDRLVVRQMTAFPPLAKIFEDTPVETWQAWAAFCITDETAPYLSKRFVAARFEFRDKDLGGQLEERPRWKRAVALVDLVLGEAVGKEYVTRHFPPESKAKMEELVENLKAALRARIERNQNLTPETKARALEKLSLFRVKIGYPTKWRDYSTLKIDPTDLLGNLRRTGEFDWRYWVSKLTKPIDQEEWITTPQTVNAFYNFSRNEIVFPAAILQAPFFDPNADPAINYGGIGGVIGHELTHGFDDQGRKSNGRGVLIDWWQPADAAKFQAEAARYGAQFDTYSIAPGVNVNGLLTMGENIADLGGLLIALDAYRASLRGRPATVLDGFTGDQRVFLGWAQIWRGKYRLDALKQQVTTDPHSPERFRVDGPLRNIDAWYEAWGVKPGDKLYLKPQDRVRLW